MTEFRNMNDLRRVALLTAEALRKYDDEVHPEIEFTHRNEKNIPQEIFDDRLHFVNMYIAEHY